MAVNSTHVYDPNNSTACTTALYNVPDVVLSTPSCLKILPSIPQICRAFLMFLLAADHSLSEWSSGLPRYMNSYTP